MKPIELVLKIDPETACARLRLGVTTQPFKVSVQDRDFVVMQNERAPIHALEGWIEPGPQGCRLNAGFGYHPVIRAFFQIWLWGALALSSILIPVTYLLPMGDEDLHFIRWAGPVLLLFGTIVSIAARRPSRPVREALLRYLDVLFRDVKVG